MEIMVKDVALVPLIVAISELLKSLGVNPKLIPIFNIALGIIGGVVYINPSDMKIGALQGLVMGLTASGLYSSYKNVNEVRK